MYQDAKKIIDAAIAENLPGEAVRSALSAHPFTGTVSLLAIGKAAWTMAEAALKALPGRIGKGLVITKYGHSGGPLAGCEIIEAGHPLPDGNTVLGAEKALALARSLGENDELLFLISGGGSALFEKPLDGVSLDDIVEINKQLLASGAGIVEMNTIRKRLSAVKAGRFAETCAPAKVFTVVLSDVLGDRLDSIASGPAAPDGATAKDAQAIARKYSLRLTPAEAACLEKETPKELRNVESIITGSVRTLVKSAAQAAARLGYTPYVLCTDLDGEAAEAGRFFAAMARGIQEGSSSFRKPCAVIAGGETVVRLKGARKSKGGRNQELAFAAAPGIAGLEQTLIFSLGSDGTDGPTDAAGGWADGTTAARLKAAGFDLDDLLANNDEYEALKAIGGLIMTGPTGTNVNDVSVLLCR